MSKVSLPVIEISKLPSTTDTSMDRMAMIRARRARLEALTIEKKLMKKNGRHGLRPVPTPSSASKMRKKLEKTPVRNNKLEPLIDVNSGNTGGKEGNELDKLMKDDPLLKENKVKKDDEPKKNSVKIQAEEKVKDTKDAKEESSEDEDDSDEENDFKEAIRQLKSLREDDLHKGAKKAREHLSQEIPKSREYIEAGAVPLLVSLLDRHHNPNLQMESLWALTNMVSGSSEDTKAVVDAGGIPPILRLLSSPTEAIAEQAVWCIANITGDSYQYRDEVVKCGAIPLLGRLVSRLIHIEGQRHLSWAFSNIIRHKPYTVLRDDDWDNIFRALKHYFMGSDIKAKLDAGWGIAFSSDGDEKSIQRVVDLGILREVAETLYHFEKDLVRVALRIVGNIVSGSNEQTDKVIQANIIPKLVTLLSTDKPLMVRKETAWALSNVLAGTTGQIQAVINANALPHLVEIVKNEATHSTVGNSKEESFSEVVKEAAWCLSNCATAGEEKQVDELLLVGGFNAMLRYMQLFTNTQPNVAQAVVEGCTAILEKASKVDKLMEAWSIDEMKRIINPLVQAEVESANILIEALDIFENSDGYIEYKKKLEGNQTTNAENPEDKLSDQMDRIDTDKTDEGDTKDSKALQPVPEEIEDNSN